MLIFTAAIACLAWIAGAAPTVHWLDTAGLSMAAASLGISHPPGQAPHSLLGSVASLLPFGDAAFRITLMSVAASAAALIGGGRGSALRTQGLSVVVLACLFLLSVAMSEAVTAQAARPEVYALSAALNLWAIRLSMSGDDARFIIAAWFLFGLSAANHPVISISVLPFLARSMWRQGVVFALLAAGVLAYLPLRASGGAAWNFGDPGTFDRLIWFLRGDLYKAYDELGVGVMSWNLVQIGAVITRSLSLVGVVLAAVGFAATLRSDRLLALRWSAAVALGVIPLAAMGNFWPDNPDAWGYILPVIWVLAAFVPIGLDAARARVRWSFIPFALLIAVALVTSLLTTVIPRGLSRDWSAHRHMTALLTEPPPTARVVSASFSTYAFMRYGQVVEGRRPDVEVVYRGLPPPRVPARAAALRTHPPSQVLLEPAITRTAEGKYALRPEDRETAHRLEGRSWFYALDTAGSEDREDSLRRRTAAVLEEVASGIEYPREPLILNYLLSVLVARSQGDAEREAVLIRDMENLFPGFSGVDDLER